MEILEKIKKNLAEIARQKEELTADLRKDFYPMLKPLFEKSNGKINSIGWKQYTPYFNDGEECTFSVKMDLDYGMAFNGSEIEESDMITVSTYGLEKFISDKNEYNKWIERYPEDAIDPIKDADQLDLYKLFIEINELLTSIPDEFYKDLFGDHIEVTVNSDGTIDTEEYEHD